MPGTVAGACIGGSCPATSYSGVAVNAKLAIYDIGNSAGGLTLPNSLVTDMFPPGKYYSFMSWHK